VTDQKTPLRGRQGAGRGPVAGRVAGPGQLRLGDVAAVEATGESLADLAKQYGLRPSARRPPIPEYVAQLWLRRHFIVAFATARNIALYTEARLGQLWQVLTPLLNAGVYFLVFGELLHINRGVPNYLGYVVTGVFVFNFTQRSFISTSTVMQENIDLIRALQFPRAALPLGYVIIELQQMALSMVVLVPILLATGEPLSWYWLLAIPALVLQTIFNVGCGLLVARMSAHVNDVAQLLPFLTRTWLYVSAVIFSISTLDIGNAGKALLQVNPAALYITLMRNALMTSQRESAPGAKPYNKALCTTWQKLGQLRGAPTKYLYDSAYCHSAINPDHLWYYAAGWAVLALVVGFFFFWRAETGYGRG
jgi:teichoic acid transport system permease protein